jgi:hypothetical protein
MEEKSITFRRVFFERTFPFGDIEEETHGRASDGVAPKAIFKPTALRTAGFARH